MLPLASRFFSVPLSDPLLAFIPLFVFVSLFFTLLSSSLPLSLSLFPSLPHPFCLLQINYALIYAQLSSQGTVLHIYHPYSWVE